MVAIKLKTDEISTLLDRGFRNDLVDNFTNIEKEINTLDSDKESPAVMQLKQNVEDIVTLLNKYDFPITYRDGKIIDLEEEN
ncbi:hypothetical protein AAHB41_05510 [Pediococcus pentosaceus]|uniref:hypothetical protein n=1 Tax=Pediococcus TaxID=1253 RepID=UPI0020CD0310|nr:hypothetical protein [Pediococcus acidilactici]MCQ0055476.1 hypothetical protein [Pediococcus acidilactici]MCQ0078101.1 hypothetical protein [Pediococcus acidilactici]